ncbi:ketopantoate reductase PanE/ApbA C terminal-domain-containing protein [Hysterangium stoloniferum]|nr:ketopantoate reductase PanE/ApbA C terminal-domain-containing protein [Hysterangium stoloniferum]
MRVHVLGVGPIGSLLAFHLRRSLPITIPISLIVKTKARARDLRANGGIAIETGGMAVTQKGFDIEVFEPLEEVVFDMVYNKGGEMRLPSTKPFVPKRSGELDGTMNMEEINKPIESLIICAKAQHTLGIFKHMRRRLTPDSTVVLLQNGMGVYEQLVHNFYRNSLERPHFVIATTSHAARAKTQGSMFHTIHVGQGDLGFGIIPDPRSERDFERSKNDTTKPLLDRELSLDDIGVKGKSDRYSSLRATIAILNSPKALRPIWLPIADLQIRVKRKLVVNSIINPLTALLSTSNGMLFGHESARYITASVCDEAAAIFAKECSSTGHPTNLMADSAAAIETDVGEAPKGLCSSELQSEVMRVASRTALNYSSMLVDTWKGRETEIEFLNGYLRRLGKFYGVPTPYNNSLYNLMRLREAIVPTVRL